MGKIRRKCSLKIRLLFFRIFKEVMRSVIIMLFIVGVAHVFIGRFSITMEKKQDIGSVEDTLPAGKARGPFLILNHFKLNQVSIIVQMLVSSLFKKVAYKIVRFKVAVRRAIASPLSGNSRLQFSCSPTLSWLARIVASLWREYSRHCFVVYDV